jgi:hypothetical protein
MHIVTRSLPDAYLNLPYSQTLEAVGGMPPYHWRLLGGDLPWGMSFDTSTATISGTPTYPAAYFFTIEVSDSDSPPQTDTYGYRINVVEGYVCGDADGNGTVNVSDAVYLLNYIFAGGPEPDPPAAGDVDCNAIVNISDAVYLLAYVFAGGPEPCANCP